MLQDARDYIPMIRMLRTASASSISALHTRVMQQSGRRVVLWDRSIPVYVNHGRWVADCPVCRSGMAAVRPLLLVWCFGCGLYGPAIWPATQAEVEEELSKRPRDLNRNWTPTESVAELKAENIERGVRHGVDRPTNLGRR